MDLKRWIRANWDRVAAWSCVVLGAVVLILGWHGVANSAYPAQQMPYIVSGGIGGALLVALGATLLISSDLRDEWQKLDQIEQRLAESDGESTETDHAAQAGSSGSNGTTPPVPNFEDDPIGDPEVHVGATEETWRPVGPDRRAEEG
jgi:hypothetical protein